MASLNTSINGPSIKSSYQGVVSAPPPSGAAASSPTYAHWAVFSVSAPLVNAFQQNAGGKESVLKVQSTGDGELADLIEEFSEGRVQFAYAKVKDPNTTLPKNVLIAWCGEGVPERTKGYFTSHLAAVSKILHGYHVQITARSDRDLTPEGIVQKVADASGAKYSAGAAPPPSTAPPVASKPVFTPTQSSSGAGGYNPLASRPKVSARGGNTDDDGWGADAPPVTQSQLEKVPSAYKPTKVNIAELRKGRDDTTSSTFSQGGNAPEVVKGGYQPIGRVDIAAIRAQAQQKQDDRPTAVKGSYEPVGKVDIAAIRAKAQKPTGEDSEEAPKPITERSAAFTPSERLTELPKPKVANKFGSSSSSFQGTKPLTPPVFGLHSAAPTTAANAQVGAASRTFADQGGKTPAQLWAEKKAKQGGTVSSPAAGLTSPLQSQTSGGGEWKSGYSGKSWAPVVTTHTGRSAGSSVEQHHTGEQDRSIEEPASPPGGFSSLKDRFSGAAPMGAPAPPSRPEASEPSPPPIEPSSKPYGGVAMPGLPTRPPAPAEEEEPQISAPPPLPSHPEPEYEPEPEPEPEPSPIREPSPVRVAVPVARSPSPEPEPAPAPMPARPSAPVASQSAGKRAIVQYDYEKAEDNELELLEGEYVTNIDMVDEDWWMGTNSKGETGLFPSNYVELVEDEPEAPAHQAAPSPPVAPAAPSPTPAAAPPAAGPTAVAIYDYEAAEDNELSFNEGDKITGLEFPDEDWWFGHHGAKSGLFPANYVELQQ